MNNVLKFFIPFAVAVTLIFAVVYVSAQQIYRQSANDPQIQIVEDLAVALSNGAPPQSIARPNATDLNKSLATFVIIYNSSRAAVLSSATLDGKTPQVPNGVFNSLGLKSGINGQSRFSWEPKDGIRVAAVLQKYDGKTPGYVLVGRSIREIEKRKDGLVKIVAIAWIITLVATFVSIYFVNQFVLRQKGRKSSRR